MESAVLVLFQKVMYHVINILDAPKMFRRRNNRPVQNARCFQSRQCNTLTIRSIHYKMGSSFYTSPQEMENTIIRERGEKLENYVMVLHFACICIT